MFDDLAPKLAKVLTESAQPVQPGNFALVIGPSEAEPLLVALYEAVLRRGGHPYVIVQLPSLQEIFYRLASDEQLDFLNPVSLAGIEHADLIYFVYSPTNTRQLSQVDPARSQRAQQAMMPLVEREVARAKSGAMRWNISPWPSQGAAQEANMGLVDYTEFIYRACALDQPDPVAHWQGVRARQDRLVTWLADKQHAQIRGPGIDLSFDFGGRTWVNSWGDQNFPSGEIFTGPIEDSVNGRVAFSYPTIYNGHRCEGVELTIENGVVVEASAAMGEAFLLSQLELDEGARRVGEFAIGTNQGVQQITGHTLFDEKIGGTIHLALGRSLPESGGVNQSLLHWDMVHGMQDGGEIVIDGELFYQSGRFLIEEA
jgi:aminopeptidase